MRQIHVCAWLVIMSSAAAACTGQQFTSSDENASSSGASAGSDYSPPSRNEAAASNDDDDDTAATSGGKSSSGGAASTGGTSIGLAGTGGVTASGGSGPTSNGGAAGNEGCAMGSVKLRMLPGPDLPQDYLCDAGCGTGWLTITDAKGASAFSLFPACGTASCESCSPLPCALAACVPTPLTTEGNSLVWSGTYLTEGTCGMNMACQRPACVPPGRYKAKACAAINAGNSEMTGGACTPKATQICAEAEFDFPETSEVALVLKK